MQYFLTLASNFAVLGFYQAQPIAYQNNNYENNGHQTTKAYQNDDYVNSGYQSNHVGSKGYQNEYAINLAHDKYQNGYSNRLYASGYQKGYTRYGNNNNINLDYGYNNGNSGYGNRNGNIGYRYPIDRSNLRNNQYSTGNNQALINIGANANAGNLENVKANLGSLSNHGLIDADIKANTGNLINAKAKISILNGADLANTNLRANVGDLIGTKANVNLPNPQKGLFNIRANLNI